MKCYEYEKMIRRTLQIWKSIGELDGTKILVMMVGERKLQKSNLGGSRWKKIELEKTRKN